MRGGRRDPQSLSADRTGLGKVGCSPFSHDGDDEPMSQNDNASVHLRWALLRFAVI